MKTKMIMMVVLSVSLTTTGISNPTKDNKESILRIDQTDSTTFKVYGKCGMCKKRIEKAALELEGVESAIWNIDSKKLTISYYSDKVKEIAIHKKIAEVGHDTEKVKASNEAYDSLMMCCKYDRPAEN